MIELLSLARRREFSISSDQSVRAATSLLKKERLPGLIVLEEEMILGVINQIDLAVSHPDRLVVDCPIQKTSQLPESMGIESAWKIMREEKVGIHPVVNDTGSLEGLISIEDLLWYIIQEDISLESITPSSQGRTILVVDDSAVVVQSLTRTLQGAGYKIETASSGNRTLEIINSGDLDLILLDVHMPGMSGYEVLKKIKASPETRGIPVIMLTAMSDVENRIKAFEEGADDYLLKPYHQKELLIRIENLLKSRSLYHELKKTTEERKHYLSRLYELQEFNERVIENMGSGLIIMDLDENILGINQAGLDILRIPLASEVTGNNIKDIHPVLEAFLEVEEGLASSQEIEYPVSEELSIHLGFSSSYLRAQDGKNEGIITIFRDLTARKKAENDLRKSGETLRALMNAITERIVLHKPDGTILACNETFARSLDKSPEELKGSCIWDYFSSEVAEQRKAYLDKLMSTKESLNFEDMCGGRYLESTAYPVFNERGEIESIALFSRDVTDTKLAEMSLYKEQAETLRLKGLLKSVMDNMMTGLMVTDNDGKIMMINRSALEILGVTEEETLERPIEELSPNLSIFREQVSPSGIGQEVSVTTADGLEVPLGFTSTRLLDPEGREIGVVTVFKDLTEVKESQRQLRVKEKLATIGEVSGAIAHEIKNPLFSISASIQTLERDVKKPGKTNTGISEDAAARLFSILYKETERINRLIKSLSLIGKGQELKPEEICPAELVEFVVGSNKGLISQKGLTVDKDFPEQLPLLQADRDKLLQVIENLFLNAVAFSPAGGVISLSISLLSRGSLLEITIGDQGPGIPEENLERVFDLFFSTRQGGSGFGLAISRKLIELHGGTIIAKNKQGGGSLFSVTIPIRRNSL